jgi:hypothetical protein
MEAAAGEPQDVHRLPGRRRRRRSGSVLGWIRDCGGSYRDDGQRWRRRADGGHRRTGDVHGGIWDCRRDGPGPIRVPDAAALRP